MDIEKSGEQKINNKESEEVRPFNIEEKHISDENGDYKYTDDIIYNDNKTGKKLCLKTLLPKIKDEQRKWKFFSHSESQGYSSYGPDEQEKREFAADRVSRLVEYDSLESLDDLFSLLHE